MLQCGFPIPIAEDSKCGIFKDVFINIGDEQSIENELSTFSSHLLNMKIMMKNAGKDSLLLIDEFGGGTEPMIGGALAQAMLKKLNNNQVFAVITTSVAALLQIAKPAFARTFIDRLLPGDDPVRGGRVRGGRIQHFLYIYL